MASAQPLNRDTYVDMVVHTLWENLPQIIGGGLLFSLCCVPAFLLFSVGFLTPTVLVAVITVAPAWCALLAFTNALLLGKRADLRLFWHTIQQQGRATAVLSMILAFPLLIMLTTLPMLQLNPVPWIVWFGISVDGFVIALAYTVLFYAIPLLFDQPPFDQTPFDQPPAVRSALRTALILAGIHPFNTVGLLAMGLLFGFLIAYVSLSLLFLLPAIYALFIVANYQLAQNTRQEQMKRR